MALYELRTYTLYVGKMSEAVNSDVLSGGKVDIRLTYSPQRMPRVCMKRHPDRHDPDHSSRSVLSVRSRRILAQFGRNTS